MYFFAQIIEQSLLMFPLVMGIYISFSVLRIADLSVDGSFVLGASVFAIMTVKGCSLLVAILCAMLAGALSGSLCALVQYRNRIDPLITGILIAFILYSLSLVIMQRPNIGLLGYDNLFSVFSKASWTQALYQRVYTLIVVAGIIALSVSLILSSRLGLWLKAFGNNQDLVSLLNHNPERFRIFGLASANALAALSGCLTAQASGYADINMGYGQALTGIAMILIGRELLRWLRREVLHDSIRILSTLAGVVLYFLLINLLIRFGLSPVYLKMAIGLLLISFLYLSANSTINKIRASS